jgi:hypothetical protein
MFVGTDIYDVSTGTLQHRLNIRDSIALVVIFPDHQLCVLNVRLWTIKTGARLQVVKRDVSD